MSKNIKSKGYAAKDNSGKLSPWEFERRPVGDNDILIDIKFASICHSDIHQMKGDWGDQQYIPRFPDTRLSESWLQLEKTLRNSRLEIVQVLAVWLIAVWNAIVASTAKNKTVIREKPLSRMAILNRLRHQEYLKEDTLTILLSETILLSISRNTFLCKKQHHYFVQVSPLIHHL